MALNSGFPRIDASSNTFSDWLNRTNEISDIIRGDDTVDGTAAVTANSSGSDTYGNARILGEFAANTLIAVDELRGGDLFSANSANLSITSNAIFTSTANLVTIEKYLQVDTDSLFVGNVEAQSTIEFTGDDSTLEFEGANQDFIWLSSNTYASIRTDATGSLELNADKNDIANDSRIDIQVDSVNVASFIEGGNIEFYSADGSSTKVIWDAGNEVLGINKTPDTNVSLDVAANTQLANLVVTAQTTSGNVVVTDQLRGATVLSITTDTTFSGANITVENELNVETDLYTAAINDVQILGVQANCQSSSPTQIDSFPLTQTKGFKYVIQGDNAANTSAYIVEIVGVHNDNDVFFTRYGEMSNLFTANITPKIVSANLVLEATCSSASPSNTHNFNIIRFETR